MRLLVLGGSGQLGKSLVDTITRKIGKPSNDLPDAITDLRTVPRHVDINDLQVLREDIFRYRPDWIINAAAYTQVDVAEVNPLECITTNSGGAANVALCAKDIGAGLVYFSTESVFDGNSTIPYSESDVCNPLSVYSISKLAGEEFTRKIHEMSYVIRTSWLYGDSTTANFPARLLANLAATQDSVPVVTDLVGNPTPVRLLAEATLSIIQNPLEAGTYHVCTSGSATKYEWAQAIAESRGFPPDRIVPANSNDFASAARRSKHVVLSCHKFISTGLLTMPHWQHYYPSQDRALYS